VSQKYNEPGIMSRISDYITKTYTQHYSAKGTQVLDLLDASECVSDYLRGSAIKYLSRFGKKGGKNINDLFKAIHCTILLIFFEEKDDEEKKSKETPYA